MIRENNLGGPGWHVVNESGEKLAWVFDQGQKDGPHNEERARLYDAAPCMLAALRTADKLLADMNYSPEGETRRTIISVIAKAEGRDA